MEFIAAGAFIGMIGLFVVLPSVLKKRGERE
jgi:hypothetical protein